jgi:hypothetical protein
MPRPKERKVKLTSDVHEIEEEEEVMPNTNSRRQLQIEAKTKIRLPRKLSSLQLSSTNDLRMISTS